jgi:hypothetical protein
MGSQETQPGPVEIQAIGRGEGQRDQRKEPTRLRARDEQSAKTLSAAEARRRQLEAPRQGLATRPQVAVVHLALPRC